MMKINKKRPGLAHFLKEEVLIRRCEIFSWGSCNIFPATAAAWIHHTLGTIFAAEYKMLVQKCNVEAAAKAYTFSQMEIYYCNLWLQSYTD